MITFLDRNGNPVDMDDPNAFIASVKVLNEADQVVNPTFVQSVELSKEMFGDIAELADNLVEAWKTIQEALAKMAEVAKDVAEAMLEEDVEAAEQYRENDSTEIPAVMTHCYVYRPAVEIEYLPP